VYSLSHNLVAQIVIDSSNGQPIHEGTTTVTSDGGAAAVSNSKFQDRFVLKSFGVIFSSKQKELEVRRTVHSLRSIRHPNVIRLVGVVKSADTM
jgi:hypothetical protein